MTKLGREAKRCACPLLVRSMLSSLFLTANLLTQRKAIKAFAARSRRHTLDVHGQFEMVRLQDRAEVQVGIRMAISSVSHFSVMVNVVRVKRQ